MPDEIIPNPTYMEHIRHFFEEVDMEHMIRLGIDLSTHPSLMARSTDVFFQTRPPNAFMPPEPNRKWSVERSTTFQNWIANGHPFGKPIPQQPQPGNVSRIRKDARDLSAAEIDKLSTAFQGLMDRAPDDPNSYFVIAGIHWFPRPTFCKHHEDRYNPWHRLYINRFEDALRTVPGCADVTMPYWDITAAPPDFLFQPPFASYTLPEEIHPDYPAGYTTKRFTAQEIAQNVMDFDIPAVIDLAMVQPTWTEFTSFIESAHDSGHPACGETLATPNAASFDPLFWFFHSNWERLWWQWQQIMQATTLWTFRNTITGSTAFLDTPPFNELKPFPQTADKTIDLSKMDIGYASPPITPIVNPPFAGSLAANRRMRASGSPRVSVRLKGVDRLAIPGTFVAVLKADGQPIARRAFFQSTEPLACENCRNHALVNLDFLVESEKIAGSALTFDIELLDREDPRKGQRMPLYACGNPTVNIRMLLEEDD